MSEGCRPCRGSHVQSRCFADTAIAKKAQGRLLSIMIRDTASWNGLGKDSWRRILPFYRLTRAVVSSPWRSQRTTRDQSNSKRSYICTRDLITEPKMWLRLCSGLSQSNAQSSIQPVSCTALQTSLPGKTGSEAKCFLVSYRALQRGPIAYHRRPHCSIQDNRSLRR